VLVVQSDDFNRSAIGTVVIVAITSNTRLAGAPGNVLMSRRDTRLRRDSVANVSQMLTVDKTFLVERVSVLPTRVRERVEAGLRLVLSL